MRIRDLLESKSGVANSTIELTSAEDDSVEVDVEFHFDVEPTEYEGTATFHEGGANLEDVKIKQFKFMGKQHHDITPDLIQYVDFQTPFEKKNKGLIDRAHDKEQKHPLTKKEANDLMKEYYNYIFDVHVSPDIKIPSKRYPMTK